MSEAGSDESAFDGNNRGSEESLTDDDDVEIANKDDGRVWTVTDWKEHPGIGRHQVVYEVLEYITASLTIWMPVLPEVAILSDAQQSDFLFISVLWTSRASKMQSLFEKICDNRIKVSVDNKQVKPLYVEAVSSPPPLAPQSDDEMKIELKTAWPTLAAAATAQALLESMDVADWSSAFKMKVLRATEPAVEEVDPRPEERFLVAKSAALQQKGIDDYGLYTLTKLRGEYTPSVKVRLTSNRKKGTMLGIYKGGILGKKGEVSESKKKGSDSLLEIKIRGKGNDRWIVDGKAGELQPPFLFYVNDTAGRVKLCQGSNNVQINAYGEFYAKRSVPAADYRNATSLEDIAKSELFAAYKDEYWNPPAPSAEKRPRPNPCGTSLDGLPALFIPLLPADVDHERHRC